jgi:hypothetical protein
LVRTVILRSALGMSDIASMAFTVSVKRVSFVVTALGCGIFGSVDWSQDNGLAQSIQSAEN